MYLTRLLSLSSTGTILIASQIPWFFKSPINPPINLTLDEVLEDREDAPAEESNLPSSTPTQHTPQLSQNPVPAPAAPPTRPKPRSSGAEAELNKIPSEAPIGRKGTVKRGDYHEKRWFNRTTVLLNVTEKEDDIVYLNVISSKKERDFILDFSGTKSKYEKISREEIKLHLFSKPVWKTEEQKEDEYATEVTSAQINSLFELHEEEYRVKQLLLSLTAKRLWKYNSKYMNKNNFYAHNAGWIRPGELDDLKKLKISYFTEFSALHDYMKNKLASCKDPKKACVADISELDTFDYDEHDFYTKTK